MDKPRLTGFQFFAQTYDGIKIPDHVENHGLAATPGEFSLTDECIFLQSMGWTLQGVESALSNSQNPGIRKQRLQCTDLIFKVLSHIPRMNACAEPVSPGIWYRPAADACQRRPRHLRQKMSMYIDNSQFSI